MQENIFGLGVFLIFSVIILSVVRMAILGNAYSHYLRKNHFEKWKEITTVFGVGPGMLNSYRAFKFLYSKDDLGDKQLMIMKTKLRNAWICVMAAMIVWPFVVLMTIYVVTRN